MTGGCLGFDFYVGPEVSKPDITWSTRGTLEHDQWRRTWQETIEQSVRDEDAWGLLRTAPDGDVTLWDVLNPSAIWSATDGYSVHLLLARETEAPPAPSHDPALTRGIEELRDHWGPTAVRAAMHHVLGEAPR